MYGFCRKKLMLSQFDQGTPCASDSNDTKSNRLGGLGGLEGRELQRSIRRFKLRRGLPIVGYANGKKQSGY
jgi:hypothetical protein